MVLLFAWLKSEKMKSWTTVLGAVKFAMCTRVQPQKQTTKKKKKKKKKGVFCGFLDFMWIMKIRIRG